MKQSDLLHIATIGKTVGIKGDMKLHIHTDFPEQFKNNSSFLINTQDRLTLREVNIDRGLIKVDGIFTPEDAKKYVNQKLYATIEETRANCKLDEGEFFWFDLIDCTVIEDSKKLGVVVDIDRINSFTYLKIQTDESLTKEGFAKTFLLPHNPPYVTNTDVEKKIITTDGALGILEAS